MSLKIAHRYIQGENENEPDDTDKFQEKHIPNDDARGLVCLRFEDYEYVASQTDDEMVIACASVNNQNELVTVSRRILKNPDLTARKLQSISQAEIENDMELEEWMTDVNEGLWAADSEEAVQLENWMFRPCDWFCLN